jgi:hypothetical protein
MEQRAQALSTVLPSICSTLLSSGKHNRVRAFWFDSHPVMNLLGVIVVAPYAAPLQILPPRAHNPQSLEIKRQVRLSRSSLAKLCNHAVQTEQVGVRGQPHPLRRNQIVDCYSPTGSAGRLKQPLFTHRVEE